RAGNSAPTRPSGAPGPCGRGGNGRELWKACRPFTNLVSKLVERLAGQGIVSDLRLVGREETGGGAVHHKIAEGVTGVVGHLFRALLAGGVMIGGDVPDVPADLVHEVRAPPAEDVEPRVISGVGAMQELAHPLDACPDVVAGGNDVEPGIPVLIQIGALALVGRSGR